MNIWELLWKWWLNFGRSYNLLGKENWERDTEVQVLSLIYLLNVYCWKFYTCLLPPRTLFLIPTPPLAFTTLWSMSRGYAFAYKFYRCPFLPPTLPHSHPTPGLYHTIVYVHRLCIYPLKLVNLFLLPSFL